MGRVYPADVFESRVLAALRQIADTGTIGALRSKPVSDDAEKKAQKQRDLIDEQIGVIEQRERDLIDAQIAAMSRGLQSETYLKMLDEATLEKRELQAARDSLKLRAVPTQTNAQLQQSVGQIVAMLDAPDLLAPGSAQLQTLHNFLAAIFERIEFDDNGPQQIGDIRIIPR